jgi:hypothetical protein
LFDEMCASLEASIGQSTTPSKRYLSMDAEALAEAIKTTPLFTEATPEAELNDILATLYRQGSILQKSISAENVSEKFFVLKFGQSFRYRFI